MTYLTYVIGDVLSMIGMVGGGYEDGSVSLAKFDRPLGMAYRRHQGLLIADSGNNCIRSVTPNKKTGTLESEKESDSCFCLF